MAPVNKKGFTIPKGLLWAALGAQAPILLTAAALPSTDLLLLGFANVVLLAFALQARHRSEEKEDSK